MCVCVYVLVLGLEKIEFKGCLLIDVCGVT